MANQNVIMLNEDNFRQEVLKSEMPVLVDFWAAWCGLCKMVGPIVEELANDYVGKAKVCKLNVDDCGRIAQSYGVMSIPTLILFKDGQEANRIVGFRPKAELAKMLEG